MKLVVTNGAPLRYRGLLSARRSSSAGGQALVEFSLVFPLLFLLIVNTVNLGFYIFDWITIADAARSGAQYWATGSLSPSSPGTPTADQVTTLVTNATSSLLSRSTLVVRVCTNTNGTVACTGSGSSTPPADPEPASYVLTTVDVTYTYTAPIPLYHSSALGIYATLPSSTIHRQVVMRMQQ